MPSREEKERRRQILNSMVEQDKVDFEKSLPVGRELFIKLFDFLDKELGENACDRTLVLTERFLKQNGVQNIEAVKEWLGERGGYCDCEVLANVEDAFQ